MHADEACYKLWREESGAVAGAGLPLRVVSGLVT
jgi:hypothetical protein